MKNAEIRKNSDTDLAKLLSEGRDALRTFRFSVAGSRVKNIRESRELRKKVARILTELSARAHAK